MEDNMTAFATGAFVITEPFVAAFRHAFYNAFWAVDPTIITCMWR